MPNHSENFCKTYYLAQGVYIYPRETHALKGARAPEVVVPVPEYERGDLS